LTGIDVYLAQVQRRLAGMDPKVQLDILRELRSHLGDSATANGGNETAAIAGFGDPVSVAKRYLELYGYGRLYRALFAILAGILGYFTVPALVAGNEGIFPLFFSAAFLALAFVFLIWVSVRAGNQVGLMAGGAALVGRVGGLAGAVAVNPDSSVVTAEGLALFALVSLLLVLVGWIPGKARQTWRRPSMDL